MKVDRAFKRKKELSNLQKTKTTQRTVDTLMRDHSEDIVYSMKPNTKSKEYSRLLEYLHLENEEEKTNENEYGTLQELFKPCNRK